MKECEKYLEDASLLADGELSPERERELAAHLESCAACRQTVEDWRLAARVAGEAPEPDEAAWEGVWARVEEATGRRRATIRMIREVKRAFATAAAAAVVLIAAYYWTPGRTTVPVAQQGSTAAGFEMAGIEAGQDYTFTVMTDSDAPVVWLQIST